FAPHNADGSISHNLPHDLAAGDGHGAVLGVVNFRAGVDTEEGKDGCGEVLRHYLTFAWIGADAIGSTVNNARADAAARHRQRKDRAPVVASGVPVMP